MYKEEVQKLRNYLITCAKNNLYHFLIAETQPFYWHDNE